MACWGSLAAIQRARCTRCALPLPGAAGTDGPARGCCARCAVRPLPFDRAIAAVDYDAGARRFLLRVKSGHRREILQPLAGQLAAAVAMSGLARALDGVVPVPSSLGARWRRGFNPAQDLAVALADATGLPLLKGVLSRRGFGGAPMKGLNARSRWRGAARRIAVGRSVSGAKLLLVDDVLTTGATATACALALRSAGAVEVRVAVWARTALHAPDFDHSQSVRL
jgi:predicted amidophosphoribosyltransferase